MKQEKLNFVFQFFIFLSVVITIHTTHSRHTRFFTAQSTGTTHKIVHSTTQATVTSTAAAETSSEKKIKDVANLYGCIGDMCVKIKEFSIFKNATLNCSHDYLEIEFEIEDRDKVKHEQFGYLINGYGLERLNDKQVVSKCKKIRRQVLLFFN